MKFSIGSSNNQSKEWHYEQWRIEIDSIAVYWYVDYSFDWLE
jgi:hypothetical protein